MRNRASCLREITATEIDRLYYGTNHLNTGALQDESARPVLKYWKLYATVVSAQGSALRADHYLTNPSPSRKLYLSQSTQLSTSWPPS